MLISNLGKEREDCDSGAFYESRLKTTDMPLSGQHLTCRSRVRRRSRLRNAFISASRAAEIGVDRYS
jgi:hypothetical protein